MMLNPLCEKKCISKSNTYCLKYNKSMQFVFMSSENGSPKTYKCEKCMLDTEETELTL